MDGENVNNNLNQGDNEWEKLDAQDQLNAEYGAELKDIDAELQKKKEQDLKIGKQALADAAAEGQPVTAHDQDAEVEAAQSEESTEEKIG